MRAPRAQAEFRQRAVEPWRRPSSALPVGYPGDWRMNLRRQVFDPRLQEWTRRPIARRAPGRRDSAVRVSSDEAVRHASGRRTASPRGKGWLKQCQGRTRGRSPTPLRLNCHLSRSLLLSDFARPVFFAIGPVMASRRNGPLFMSSRTSKRLEPRQPFERSRRRSSSSKTKVRSLTASACDAAWRTLRRLLARSRASKIPSARPEIDSLDCRTLGLADLIWRLMEGAARTAA